MMDFKLPVWVSNYVGNEKNCRYPHECEAYDADTLKKCFSKDHVFIKFKDNYRSDENFMYADVLVLDCDNTHSDDPEDWYTPEEIAKYFPMTRYITYTSRNNMKQKGDRAPRPRFHVIFFVERITDSQTYKNLFTLIREYFPHFDSGAKDAARFFFGNPETEIYISEGSINLSQFLNVDTFVKMESKIYQGRRNDQLFATTLASMTRYGVGEESKDWFTMQSSRCEPPLDDKELRLIWRQCKKYYLKISKSPNYVAPAVYNGKIDPIWSEPIPFSASLKELFPVDALPAPIADYVRAVSESTQTPVDMVGTSVLTLSAVCIQGKYVIMGKPDWIEQLSMFANIIAYSSERKSAVLHAAAKPLDNYEIQFNIRNAAHVESSKMRKRILERRQKAIEDKVAKGNAEVEELEQIAQEIADFQEEKPLHLYVDDITTEKLVSVMASNNGRAALISSEGGIFDTLAGIYTKNVNIDVMLKGYSGDTIRVDRIGRESESIMNPALTILLMTQPKVISDVLSNATFRGRGLTARFLYCLPVSSVGSRNFQSTPVPDEIYQRYEKKMVNMLQEEYPPKAEVIKLSDEALKLLTDFANGIEPKLKTEYAEIADWVGKLVGNTLRIAGVLCRAEIMRAPEFLTENEPLVVSGKTMNNAIKLGRYYLSHALAVYDVIPEASMHKQANRILKMIKEKKLSEFDRRIAMRNCRVFKTVAEIQPVLDFLDDYGYIVRQPEKTSSNGRPPLPKYTVNPAVMSLPDNG